MARRRDADFPALYVSHSFTWPMELIGDNPHDALVDLLFEGRNPFPFVDQSIGAWNPLKRAKGVKGIGRGIERRMAESEMVVVAVAGVQYERRYWIRRELAIARNHFTPPKPVLAVRPRGARFLSRYFTDRADAWAVWERRSIVAGIRALRGLTAARRQELLDASPACPQCGGRSPRLELNQLRGAYCARCGHVLHRQRGARAPWTYKDLVYEGFPLAPD